MPRLDENILSCSANLYPSVEAAREGKSSGGSAFLIGIPYQYRINGALHSHVYAVTNSHVVRDQEGESPVLRVNRSDGNSDILDFRHCDWIDDSEDDLALCYINERLTPEQEILFLLPGMFIQPWFDWVLKIGIGTDTITIGRFVPFEQSGKNSPVARFGHIASAEPVPVPNQRGGYQLSWLVEGHSISGFSGSPVFACNLRPEGVDIIGLLGVNWGHYPHKVAVKNCRMEAKSDQIVVDINSGMMTVIPVSRLSDFLYRTDLVTDRQNKEIRAARDSSEVDSGGIRDVAP